MILCVLGTRRGRQAGRASAVWARELENCGLGGLLFFGRPAGLPGPMWRRCLLLLYLFLFFSFFYGCLFVERSGWRLGILRVNPPQLNNSFMLLVVWSGPANFQNL